MNENLLSITWNNHSSVLTQNIDNFFRKPSYCDATLICERKHIQVHKIVLSACSEYFREIFDDIFCLHPYIILKDVALTELHALLEFMYVGKTSIFKSHFKQFLNAADYFRVQGLSVSNNELCSSVKISNIRSNYFTNSCNMPVSDRTKSISISNKKDEIFKELRNDSSSTETIADKCNESTSLKKSPFSSVDKMQKSNDNGTISSCPQKGKKVALEPVVLLNHDEDEKISNALLKNTGNKIIGKMKPSENSSLLPERVASNNHRVSRSGNKSSSISTTEKIKVVPPNSNELNLNNLSDQSFHHNCLTCGFSAKYLSQLAAHMKTHNVQTTKISKRYKCSTCTFSTVMKSHLERHMKGHKKPLKCKNCPFRASLNISMKKHEKTCKKGSINVEDLSNDDELPDITKPAKECLPQEPIGKDYFQCAFCSHKTCSENLLTNHVKNNH